MAIQFTRNGRKAMLWAQVEAMRRGESYVEREHLLLGLLHGEGTGALRLLETLGYAPEELRLRVGGIARPEIDAPRPESAHLSPLTRRIVEQARRETEKTGHDFVGTEHLLLALLHDDDPDAALVRAGLTYAAVAQALSAGLVGTLTDDAPRTGVRAGFLKGRHVLEVGDLSAADVEGIFSLTREIKLGKLPSLGAGKTAALLFEKPSLRTKVSFHVAMARLGGGAVYLGRDEVGLGKREAVKDVARTLSRMVDAIVVRTFDHAVLQELARWASVPVINALDDVEHPCQALADFYTIREHRADTRGQKLVFIGDGNNVAVSLLLLAPVLGCHFTLACPPGYEPPAETVERARALAQRHGTTFEIVHDPVKAADDADILYTDVWISMGQEDDTARRRGAFTGFQIDARTLREAKDDVLVLHCLPAHRGDEITDEAIEGEFSKVFDQAENRLHVQQALLAAVL